jgi:hypothetical protein
LDLLEVLNISNTSNTLIISGNDGDSVDMGDGWSETGTEVIGEETFTVFAQGSATLKLGLGGTSDRLKVYVASTDWTDDYRDVLDGTDDDTADLPGVLLEASQLLAWPGLDTVIVELPEGGVNVVAGDVTICGTAGPLSMVSGSFETVEVDGKTRMTWQLSSPLGADQLKLVLDDAIGGGELEFSSLPGDVNKNLSVNLADAFQVFNKQDDADYDLVNDVNGNFVVNLVDVFRVVDNLDLEFPSGDPDCAEAVSVVHAATAPSPSHIPGLVAPDGLSGREDTPADNDFVIGPEYPSERYGQQPEVRLVDQVLLLERVYEEIFRSTEEDDNAILRLDELAEELL